MVSSPVIEVEIFFLCLSLVNFFLLASLEKRFTYRKLEYFLTVGSSKLETLKGKNLADGVIAD